MKWNKQHIILTALLPVQFVIINLIKNFPNFIETYYSNGIYPIISSFFRIIFGWIPYSVGDLFLFVIVFLIFRFIYETIKQKFRNSIYRLLKLTSYISIFYFCFYIFWGLNYFRQPLENAFNFNKSKYTTEELTNTTRFIIGNLNNLQFQITNNDSLSVENPYSIQDNYELAFKGYKNLEIQYPIFSYKYKSVKSSLMSIFQSYIGTSGYLNPLTGEAQVNNLIPKTSLPTTACHEMAHQIGFAAENEANFIGFLAANFNDDLFFKYSSFRMAFGYCISEIRKRDKELYKQLWQEVNLGVKKDYQKSYKFWQSYQNPFEPLIKKGYSSYLKSNNQVKGTDSYSYVVDLLISYYKSESKI